MKEQGMPPGHPARRDAIDVDDLVYAATGTRVRRLTMPDGNHWFAAVDVAGDLGYANPRDAIAKHVPPEHAVSFGDLAQTLAAAETSYQSPGPGLKKSMKMVNLHGLIRLVSACTKPEAEPFKHWVTELVTTVQKNGTCTLQKAEVQPAGAGAPVYAMPREVADAILGLEKHSLRLGEELAGSQCDARLPGQAGQLPGTIAHLLGRIAESLERRRPHRSAAGEPWPNSRLSR